MKKETDCSFETEAAMLAENLLAISEKLRIAQQKLRMLQRLYTTRVRRALERAAVTVIGNRNRIGAFGRRIFAKERREKQMKNG